MCFVKPCCILNLSSDGKNGIFEERTLLDKLPTDKEQKNSSKPDVQVKSERGEEARARPELLGKELETYERDNEQWIPRPEEQEPSSSNYYKSLEQSALSCLSDSTLNAGLAAPGSSSGAFLPSPYSRGPLSYSPFRTSFNTVRRRTAKKFMFKKGFVCPYCGKTFERAGHLERHKLIHTGEKPYRCELCGRRFNQKCSLKGHLKTHRVCKWHKKSVLCLCCFVWYGFPLCHIDKSWGKHLSLGQPWYISGLGKILGWHPSSPSTN